MKSKSLVIGGVLAAAITAGSIGVAAFGLSSVAGAQGANDAVSTQAVQAVDPTAGAVRHPGLRAERARKVMKAVADELGMQPAELRAELKSGKSVAEVATTKGVDVQTLTNNLVAKADARIDEAVANNKITADRAATMKQKAPDRITTFVNRHFGHK